MQVYSQDSCKVLKPEISEHYVGKCKKGLAHGRGIAVGKDRYDGSFKKGMPHGSGIYYYANREVYEGEFNYGLRQGIGKMIYKRNGRDSVVSGYWNADKFVRVIIPPKYRIIINRNIQRVTVQKLSDKGKRVLFAFMQNGTVNYTISNLNYAPDSGTSVTVGNNSGFENVIFPFDCKLNYVTANQTQRVYYEAVFEIKIDEPGEWLITLHN